MNNALAPDLEYSFGKHIVLWFTKSNTYSVVDCHFKSVLDVYLGTPSKNAFYKALNHLPTTDLDSITKQLEDYLHSCQIEQESPFGCETSLNPNQRKVCKVFGIDDKTIILHTDSPFSQHIVCPSIARYEVPYSNKSDTVFDIYAENGNLNLFQNKILVTSVPKADYHFIQGKFHFLISNLIHQKNENEWLGTLHASAVTNEKSAVLFIGNSGSGKSTLCSLLVANGYKLLADDISPLGKNDGHIYYNPAALSVKYKAFKILEPLFPELKTLPEITFNPFKGTVKYLPCPQPEQMHYPCNTMVLVEYKPQSETLLEPLSIKEALETFIPDSWIHPGEAYASAFLNWLDSLEFYKLRYSNTTEMLQTVSQLFKSQDEQS